MQIIRLIAVMVPLVAALAACASSGQKLTSHRFMATGAPVLHAVDSHELREVMNRMNNLMLETNLTEQEMDEQRGEALSRVAGAANKVEQAVDGILATQPKLNLAPDEQKIFQSLVINLRGEARRLKSQTRDYQATEIPATLEKMSATCTACHELFRDFSKPGAQK